MLPRAQLSLSEQPLRVYDSALHSSTGQSNVYLKSSP